MTEQAHKLDRAQRRFASRYKEGLRPDLVNVWVLETAKSRSGVEYKTYIQKWLNLSAVGQNPS